MLVFEAAPTIQYMVVPCTVESMPPPVSVTCTVVTSCSGSELPPQAALHFACDCHNAVAASACALPCLVCLIVLSCMVLDMQPATKCTSARWGTSLRACNRETQHCCQPFAISSFPHAGIVWEHAFCSMPTKPCLGMSRLRPRPTHFGRVGHNIHCKRHTGNRVIE